MSLRVLSFQDRMQQIKNIREYYSKDKDFLLRCHAERNPRPIAHDLTIYHEIYDYTPIEENVWDSIWINRLPLFPQYPVGKYFLDFGSPFLKFGIEVDGKEFHTDKEKDKKRQEEIEAMGYTIVRFPGHSTYETFYECYDRLFLEENGDYDLLHEEEKISVIGSRRYEYPCLFCKFMNLIYDFLPTYP